MAESAYHFVEIPYGTGTLTARLESVKWLDYLDVKDVPAVPDPAGAIYAALQDPLGLYNPVRYDATDSLLILVSDSFRQTRADQMLPVLLQHLRTKGLSDRNISILFSTGVHRAPTVDEQKKILGEEVFARLAGRIHCHDAHDTAVHERIGVTSKGTPVEINRRLLEASHVIATGTVVLHYFGGFGGGRKSIVPGVASAKTIAANHSLNLHPCDDRLDPAVRIARMDGNPVAEDMFEAASMVKIDFILNTVLTRDAQIAAVFCGEMELAHRKACEFAYAMYAVPIDQRADLVIAASPYTKNFVQTHKALYNAFQAVHPGGRIILVAPCVEGLGSERFAKWLALGSRSSVIAELRKNSEINGQTALSTLEKAPCTLFVTELSDSDVGKLGGRKVPTFHRGVNLVMEEFRRAGRQPSVYVMPTAAYTVPQFEG